MEKHCERQHGMIPPGGRGHYISSSEAHTTEKQPIVSPFQQVRSYPVTVGQNSIFGTDSSHQVNQSSNDQPTQPNLVYPATR